jgi:tripartite ATP-independent transporter DctM subunit
MLTVWLLTTLNPDKGPKGPKTTFREKAKALKQTWEVLLLFIVVIGGIYAGMFTPTEAAGVGAFGTFFFALVRKRLSWKVFNKSLVNTLRTTGMLFLIMMGAMIFGYFLSISQLPFELANLVGDLSLNRYIVLSVILVITLALGCIMDSMAIVLLTIPVFYPLIVNLGFDPIWFGILVVMVTEMGLITPPVGMNVFVIKGISDVPISTIFRGIIPFFIADLALVAFLVIFPQIVLFIPNLMS